MSVADRLRAFRYVTSAREVPWIHLRSIDVPSHRVRAPDLQEMKNLISILSDCNLAPATAPSRSQADVAQLLSALQLALQFLLWSQSVLKEQLTEQQSTETARRVHVQYVEGLEAKLETAKQEAVKLREERDTFQLACRGLEQRLTQAETTVRVLEKEFHAQRERRPPSFDPPPLTLSPPQPLRKEQDIMEEYQTSEEGGTKRKVKRRQEKKMLNELERNDTTMEQLLRLMILQQSQQFRVTHSHAQTAVEKGKPAAPATTPTNAATGGTPTTTTTNSAMNAIDATVSSEDTTRLALDRAAEERLQRAEALLARMQDCATSVEHCAKTAELAIAQQREQTEVATRTMMDEWSQDARAMLRAHLSEIQNRFNTTPPTPALQHHSPKTQDKTVGNEKEEETRESTAQANVSGKGHLTPSPTSPSFLMASELPCLHCRQRFPPAELAAHELHCELRLVPCEKCGRSVVARLLPRHNCEATNSLAAATSAQGTPASASLVRPSSLLLQETQRELQQLLQEEEENVENEDDAGSVWSEGVATSVSASQ